MTIDLTLVLGGSASGKSAWAENYVLSFSKQPIYVVTAQAYDDEMVQRAPCIDNDAALNGAHSKSHWR